MELNVAILSDFTKSADLLWWKGLNSVPQVMRKSGLFKITPISNNSGDTREFSEIDIEEYANNKDESDQAARAKVQQGLNMIALVKSSLINGENLTAKAKATLSKQAKKIAVQLQRLSERTLFISEATVRSA